MFSGIPEKLLRAEQNKEAAYSRLRTNIINNRPDWVKQLATGKQKLTNALRAEGYAILTGERRENVLAGLKKPSPKVLPAKGVVITSRLKKTEAIIGKMQRYGESLANMLDVWGYRVIVSDEHHLDRVASILGDFWETPSPEELLLRGGTLEFEWFRDYRKRTHTGLSDASSVKYDQAINMNRKADFAICEIQVMTYDLYWRAFVVHNNEESHFKFANQRRKLLKKASGAGKG